MLNDLSVFTEPWRKKRPYGYTGDPAWRTTRRRRRLLPLLHGRRDARQGGRGWPGRLPAARRRAGGDRGARLRPASVKRVFLRVHGGSRGRRGGGAPGPGRPPWLSLGPGQAPRSRSKRDGASATTTRTSTCCSSGRTPPSAAEGGTFVESGCRSARNHQTGHERARRPRRARGDDRPLPGRRARV